ncbi:sugar ABC transporter ATP-binding protein [Thalassospira sp.]|uniref:sugar ABC transporter ATP-binding protein n=1 Tax=Thalassospira sp. TaxID=1912094 RepID=UPI001B10540B|nr:sugar ABC transporter ATP-binding protein [Thalassospira sp.]MBO6807223.1 sugar ABC transporter ATP-binding protein [Thalassospira sp.]MBO6841630.1 sugar ABC transporter ATP-binding protein [Thalassospira sp.]
MSAVHELDLRLEGVTKVYPGVVALDDVSLQIKAGEVIGLLGENGAGKSTLMKILGGLIAPTSGKIILDGQEYDGFDVKQSQQAGIAFVHQELNVFDNMDVSANIFLGREKVRGPLRLTDRKAMNDLARPLLERVGAPFKPETMVSTLSLAERQLLEIAKALSVNARLVIMDEPTSSLTLSETNMLLKVIADLKTQGIAVVYISHRLSEVEECVDRAVVLRDGRNVGGLAREEVTHDAMIRMMIGRDLKSLYTPPAAPATKPILSVKNLSIKSKPDHTASFDLMAGEILGVAGLIGAGRTDLAEAIFGAGEKLGGEISLDGATLEIKSPSDAIAAGLYLVPEDRKRAGLILEFPTLENVTMASLPAYTTHGIVSLRRQMAVAEAQRKALGIKTHDVRSAASEMSGGNQQKVVLAKWLSMNPKVIIFDEPTRGIDVGAKAEIYGLMRSLADRGVGVMMISSDMEEVIGVSDRIVVMKDGVITGELPRLRFSESNVLNLAVGKVLEEA